jgi:acyl-CoA synthetase (AMP-forming)/AMP-acid ligase II
VTTEFNIGRVHETVADAVPDRECIVWGERRLTYRDVTDRSRRLASHLHRAGLGVHAERRRLKGWESGQDHLALYLYNGNEYIEGMLGAFKARLAPFNVNYRYVAEELRYLFDDGSPRAIVYHASFAPLLAGVLPSLPDVAVLLQVADESGEALLPGAVDYEDALAQADTELPPVEPSPDDLYLLYTGGTTGMPKGVAWRQDDIFMAAMGGRQIGTWQEFTSYDEIADAARAGDGMRIMPTPPLMHGAAQWAAFICMTGGGTLVIQENTRRLDPADVWRTVERDRVQSVTVVGDAIARPLIEELERGHYDISSLAVLGNGGAPLNPVLKQRLLDSYPNLIVSDAMGASETGAQAAHLSTKDGVSTGKFSPGPGAVVVDESLTRLLEPGDDSIGWLAQQGHVPLGYLHDEAKTKRTFPLIGGLRYAVPGDRAIWLADGTIELLGRDAVTINSGGEKIFAEEVEKAIGAHAGVRDVVCVGRPSERWGQEVVALVALSDDTVTDAELAETASAYVARYKLPKAWIFLPEIRRSPTGKADYRWAAQTAREAAH